MGPFVSCFNAEIAVGIWHCLHSAASAGVSAKILSPVVNQNLRCS